MYYLEDNDVGSESAGSFGLMPSGWFYQNMLTISRMHTEYTLAAVDEKAHRIYPAISEKGTQRVAGLSRGPYTVFARMLLPALEKAVQKSARMQTYLDATRVGCGVERYRLANGKLPETLDALAPRYISVIPNDVIDGKPLKYRPDNDRGYIIYSVGWNQTDDGGQVIWIKHKEESRADVNKGDWVWFMKG